MQTASTVVAAGIVIRSLGSAPALVAGTVIIGTVLTIGNIGALIVIGRDFAGRTASITGTYTAALNVGTMLTSACTAPLAALWGWQWATGIWSLMAVASAALWHLASRRSPTPPPEHATTPTATANAAEHRHPSRRPYVWLLALALGLHLFIYYALTTWLPSLLGAELGMTEAGAGLVASLFQILALLGAFGVPAVGMRVRHELILVVMAVLWLVTCVAILLVPAAWPLWCITGGITQGGLFTILFMLIVDQSRDSDDNRRSSALVQGWAYALSAAGPVAIGALHEATNGWSAPMLTLVAAAAVLVAGSLAATRIQP